VSARAPSTVSRSAVSRSRGSTDPWDRHDHGGISPARVLSLPVLGNLPGDHHLRAEGSVLVYGAETQRVPLSPTVPFVDVDMETTNDILSAGLGPQINVGAGPARLDAYGTVGFAYFSTSTSVKGLYEDEPIASTINFDDFRLSLAGGGGIAFRIAGGDGQHPLPWTSPRPISTTA